MGKGNKRGKGSASKMMGTKKYEKKRRKGGGDRKSTTHNFSGGGRGRKRKLEIKFDPEARKEYLTGMSARKKERRVFGLAMQKVKDRREKLDRKKDDRKSKVEKMEEAERMKKLSKGLEESDSDDSDSDEVDPEKRREEDNEEDDGEAVGRTKSSTYNDSATEKQFGGCVVVTTTFGVPSDDEDDPDTKGIKLDSASHVDTEQRYAGNVKRYMDQVRSHLPAKKHKRDHHSSGGHHKGKHGAAGMKGMGTGKDFKMAQKVLGRAEEKSGGGDRGGGKGKKGKGKKRRR